jgi:class 3 adenylate cyclase
MFSVPGVFINILGDELGVTLASTMPGPSVTPRCTHGCNFVVYRRAPVVFTPESGLPPVVQFYAGAPLLDSNTGHALGTVCAVDFKPRPDFSKDDVKKLEAIAQTIMQHLELRKLRLDVQKLEHERKVLQDDALDRSGPPPGDDETTYVFTDIENSTALWEADPKVMNEAQRVHDTTLRASIGAHHGTEVTTEGDAFFVAFWNARDAINYCLQVQRDLLVASWPDAILKDERAGATTDGVWRGPRVRMGVHTGPSNRSQHPVTQHIVFAGGNVSLAREVGDAAHGGQILVTPGSWAQAHSHMQDVGIIHLGAHMLKGEESEAQLLHVFAENLRGRDFSDRPPVSIRKTAPSYFDAPKVDGGREIAICFAVAGRQDQVRLLDNTGATFVASLDRARQVLRPLLEEYDGYLCQEDEGTSMFAFAEPKSALAFGAAVHTVLAEADPTGWPEALRTAVAGNDKQLLFPHGVEMRVGVFAGVPEEMRPHTTSGRADYFGPVLNRAARVAYAANAGQTLAPSELTKAVFSAADAPTHMNRKIEGRSAGQHAFKGVSGLVDIDEVVLVPETSTGDESEHPQPPPQTILTNMAQLHQHAAFMEVCFAFIPCYCVLLFCSNGLRFALGDGCRGRQGFGRANG